MKKSLIQLNLSIVGGFAALALVAVSPLASCGKSDEGGGKTKVDKNKKPTKPSTNNNTGTTTTPTGSSDYEEMASVANAGTISGTISYTGDKKAPPLKVSKNPDVCSHGGEPDGSLVVADSKLKNAVVYLDGIDKGKKWTDGKPVVDNVECLFDPRVAIGRHKGPVAAKNSDPLLHNTNLVMKDSGKTIANISLPNKGQVSEKKLKKAGVMSATCDVHEWMQAWVFVTPHPYAVVTAADGTFTLDDVPAGEYTAKVWHETLGEAEMKVKVEAGKAATLDHTFN